MFPAEYYKTIYLITVAFLTLLMSLHVYRVRQQNHLQSGKEILFPSLALCVIVTLFIGTRPISFIFVDMGGYAAEWEWWNKGTFEFSWDWANVIFDNMRVYMATIGVPVVVFFFLIALIYFGCMYIACRKMFPRDTFMAFLVTLGAFSTFSFGTNGIKAGAAASIFLLAVAYHRNVLLAAFFAIISWGFHHSMVMVVASFAIVYIIRNPKFYFVVWGASLLIAALHISVFQQLFGAMADEGGAEYLHEQTFGKGFRIDFILYSAMPVLVGAIAIFKKKIQSIDYRRILNLYLLTNSIWMLCMYAEFTNRIAYLSWFLYPVVLIYPFLNEKWGENQFNTLKNVALAHIAFTLFMEFVFYA